MGSTTLPVFSGTILDDDVPATLLVDGKTYQGVGLHFRGKSSYFRARTGQKRSLNISLDHVDQDQRLHGYKTLNLNNSFGDASAFPSGRGIAPFAASVEIDIVLGVRVGN